MKQKLPRRLRKVNPARLKLADAFVPLVLRMLSDPNVAFARAEYEQHEPLPESVSEKDSPQGRRIRTRSPLKH